MDDHALAVLEYPALLAHLSSCAHSEPGRALALALRPQTSAEAVEQTLALTAEGGRLLEAADCELSMVKEAAPVLARLAVEGATLSAAELLLLYGNQRGVREARRTLKAARERVPLLAEELSALSSFPEWEEWVGSSLEESGEVKDSASAGLSAARRALREAKEAVTSRLTDFMGGEKTAKVLRERYVTLRNGRYVIPVKPEYHRAFRAVVQDTSASGQTVFVEPLFAVALNNRHIEAAAAEEEEVRRVLAEMTETARGHREKLAENLRLLAGFDLRLARARLGKKLSAVVPELDPGRTVLTRACHPLLVLDKGGCVPVDIEIGGAVSALVITGPNTGGKTVALKTLGLLTAMAQSGIPVPAAEGSRFRVFTKLFADIGDEQSIAQSLSTFSAHMTILSRVLRASDGGTLVLADELGAGTDPQEGSALAVAVLEALHRRGACAVVTTHHNLLKEFAYRTPWAANASVVFDGTTLRPTYELRTGTPGRSHALQIAANLGVDQGIVERARELMGSGAVEVDRLIERLSDEVGRESAARTRAEELAEELSRQQEELHKGRQRSREEAERLRAEAEREARALLRELKSKGKALLRAVREKQVATPAAFGEKVSLLEEKVAAVFPRPRPGAPPAGPLRAGARVVVRTMGMEGEAEGVVERLLPEKEAAEILSGGLRLRVPLSELVVLEGPEEGGGGGGGISPGKSRYSYQGDGGAPGEINLLGKTVEEALEAVDRLIDRHQLGPGKHLRIIHGMGTGALRRAIREALSRDPRVLSFRPGKPEEGGTGATMVELRD